MPRKKHDEDNPSIKMLYDKISTLEKYVAENRNDIKWLKKIYASLSNRQWLIVTGIIISILIQLILLAR